VNPKSIVVIPTYNESANVASIISKIRKVLPELYILVIDDGSPDGTANIVDEISSSDPKVQCLRRTSKDGIGRAYIAGFTYALENGFEFIGQMDADHSHSPSDLVRLLEASTKSDLVIGSRYVRNGGTVNWPLYRKLLSRLGGIYASSILNMKINDPTGGFKVWNATLLKQYEFSGIQSSGYVFTVEMTYRAIGLGAKIIEVPITFTERVAGVSKMDGKIMLEAATLVWKLRHSNKRK
jgi:dolichol-phosphate mannosyltransferase